MSCKQEVKSSLEKNQEKQDNHIAKPEIERVKDSLVIRYFPKVKDTVKLDTLISYEKIRIVLIESYIKDSYVTNSFKTEKGVTYEDRYLDSKRDLQIFKGGKQLVDTSFIKSSFLNERNKELLKVANFHGYWFKGANRYVVDFFGAICQPETDWCYDFYHIYDLKEKKFITKEYIDPEGG